MIALQFADIKDFMHKLLCTELFDHFRLSEASIRTWTDFTINGRLNQDFFDPEDEAYQLAVSSEAAPFAMLRPICFQLMKGTRTPLGFHLVFQLSPANQRRTIERCGCGFLPEDISGMFWNLKYQNRQLTCTTGISYRTFSMDKSLEQEWDRLTSIFFKNNKIPFEIL